MKDAIHDRGAALENQFFHQRDQELLERLRAEMAGGDVHAAITKATGITDQDVIKRLVDAKITAETLTSFSLIPLVMVAWADGSIKDGERIAILDAGEKNGLHKGDASSQLLDSWLKEKPQDGLLATWKEYVQALKKATTEEDFAHMRSQVIGRAQRVADAAGGFLGFGDRVSGAEKLVIAELEEAFK